MKAFLLVVMQCTYLLVNAQIEATSCTIELKKKSFGKEQIHIMNVNNSFTDSIVFSKDTLIGKRTYYRSGLTSHYLYDYWSEDDDGTVWYCFPYYNTGEICYLPRHPFVGYQVNYNHFVMRIIEMDAKKTFGSVSYDHLIVCEINYSAPNVEDKWTEYFKKGVGWVAMESDVSTTYLKCIKYR